MSDPMDYSLLSIGFSRQEYRSELPCPPPGNLPHPGIEPASLTSPALSGGFFNTGATWEALLFAGPAEDGLQRPLHPCL